MSPQHVNKKKRKRGDEERKLNIRRKCAALEREGDKK
jgi:hypothetical protein